MSSPDLLSWLVAVVTLASLACHEDPVIAVVEPEMADMGVIEDLDMPEPDMVRVRNEVGQPCMTPRDCVEGALCVGSAQGGFVCMAGCEEPWRICTGGSVCMPVATGEAVCFIGGGLDRGERCQVNIDCAPGQLCLGDAQASEAYCLEACHTLDAQVCTTSQLCRPINTNGKGYCLDQLGDRCSSTLECQGTLVCSTEALEPEAQAGLPQGYCTVVDCVSDEDCPGDGRCRPVAGGSMRQICYDGCLADVDCRFAQGYGCYSASDCQGDAECMALYGDTTICTQAPMPGG